MNGFAELYGSNGPQKFTIEMWGTTDLLPRYFFESKAVSIGDCNLLAIKRFGVGLYAVVAVTTVNLIIAIIRLWFSTLGAFLATKQGRIHGHSNRVRVVRGSAGEGHQSIRAGAVGSRSSKTPKKKIIAKA